MGFCATPSAIAYLEDLIWDPRSGHDRGWLFGAEIDIGRAAMLLAPLPRSRSSLATLDGFL
jgi:hypothetical protein